MALNAAPSSRNHCCILKSSLSAFVRLSKKWGQDRKLTKSQHLSVGDSPCSITYNILYFYALNIQNVKKVSNSKNLRTTLNTRLSAENYVIDAAHKNRGMLFYLKLSFVALTLNVFSHFIGRLSSQFLNTQFKHHIHY